MARELMDLEKDFDNLRREFNQLMSPFDSLATAPFLGSSLNKSSLQSPAADLYETDSELVASIELPGVKKENIKLEVNNDVLSVKAEHKQEKEDKNKGYHKLERSYATLSRTMKLPTPVEENKVKANFKDGILEVHMPKKNKEEGRKNIINID